MKNLFFIAFCLNIFNFSQASELELYKTRAKLLCDQFNSIVEFNYEKHYSQKFIKKVPKKQLDSIFVQLSSAFGKCSDFHFPDFKKNKNKFYIETDKLQTLEMYIYLNKAGLISKFNQNGIVDNTPLEKEEIFVKMSDGVELRTFVYKSPGDNSKKEVVLTRTPYLKIVPWDAKAKYFVKRGYIFILQSIRGMYGSSGTYKIFNRKEIDDGYETINWIEEQKFSNGNIAITGTSYDGFTALAAGVKNPKGLKVIFSGGAPSELEYSCFRTNGILNSSLLDYLRYNQTSTPPAFTPNYRKLLIEKLTNNVEPENYDEVLFNIDLSEWNDIIKFNNTPDAIFFKERSIFDSIKNIAIPTYHIAGLRQDGDLIDTIRNFKEVDRHSVHREKHHLYLGYWDHGNSTPYSEVGVSKFVEDRYDDLMKYYLRGIDTTYAHEKRIFIESTKLGEFISGDKYPLPSTPLTLYFSEKRLNAKKDENPDSSHYKFYKDTDSSKHQSAYFVIVPNLDIPIWGEINFELFFKFNAPQMDLIVSIIKKDKDSKTTFITNCVSTKVVKNNSEIVRVNLNHCPVLNTIKKGEALIVRIGSNMFPVFFQNRNSKDERSYQETDIEFLHSLEYPSSITLNLNL